MNELKWESALEAALHAIITERCRRAYRHDLRNGLQGIYTGFDALTRTLTGAETGSVSATRAVEFVRHAIAVHEKSLDRIVDGLVLQNDTATIVDVGMLLHELAKFLLNDAAACGVSLRVTAMKNSNATVRASKARLAILSLMVDAIDAMPAGGELQLAASSTDQRTLIEISATFAVAVERHCIDLSQLDWRTPPSRSHFILQVVTQLVAADGGTMDCESSPGQYTIKIYYRS